MFRKGECTKTFRLTILGIGRSLYLIEATFSLCQTNNLPCIPSAMIYLHDTQHVASN
jgi:hypothetical protein